MQYNASMAIHRIDNTGRYLHIITHNFVFLTHKCKEYSEKKKQIKLEMSQREYIKVEMNEPRD